MNLIELIETRKSKLADLEYILKTNKLEKRKLSAVESHVFDATKKEIDALDTEITKKNNNITSITKTQKRKKMENTKFNLLKAIAARANGQSIEEYAEFIEAGKAEMRKAGLSYSGEIVLPMEHRSGEILAQTQYAGQEVVAEDKFSILEPLRDSLTLVQAGANFISGLVGDVSIPTYAGTSALWKGEIVAAGNGAGAFAEVNLSPKRLTTYIDISRQFLNQDSASAEQMLYSDIYNAISDKLEQTILGAASGSTTQPAGIFYGATDVTGTTAYVTLVNMEQALAESKVSGNYAFIMSPATKATLKTTLMATGSTAGFILSGADVIGYPYFTTNAVPTTRIALAKWSELIIASWGSIDLIVDNYTVAKEGLVRLVINAYFDAKFRRDVAVETATIS